MSKHTKEEVRDYVESEGIGYAVQHGMSAESIKNPRLRKLWQAAADALNAIDAELGLE